MATIYSNRNDGTGSHIEVNPNDAGNWAGNSVPTASDQVYIVGRRTTWNNGTTYKWTGTKQINVGSTTGFATSGFFYSHTVDGQRIKIDYSGTTSTAFLNCVIDETYDLGWDLSGDGTLSSPYIANGYYVQNPAYIFVVDSVFECNQLILQEGGWIEVRTGGTLIVNEGILVRDGYLIGSGSGSIVIRRPYSSSSTIGYLNAENYYMSYVDIDGGEVRAHATIASTTAPGATSITISDMTNGSFAKGDDIAIYKYNEYRYRDKGYTGYRDASVNLKAAEDEGLDCIGVSGNTVYVALRNGARGDIKAVGTSGSQKYLEVFPDNLNFNVGDTIITSSTSNGSYQTAVIEKIEDSEFVVYDYDFTNSSTTLSDFIVDEDISLYSSGWTIDQYGLTQTQNGYKELVHKYFWERDCVLEAYMSPLAQFDTGTRDGDDFGILNSYDPAFRKGHRGYDSFKTDYLRIDDNADNISFYMRAISNYPANRLSRDNTFRTSLREPAFYRIDSRKGRSTITINGQEFTQEYRREGNFKGLVGFFTENNTSFHCQRFTIKIPTQKLFFTSAATFVVDPTKRVYRSGMEKPHTAGSKIVKIASINTGNGNHTDLAFAYRGQYGNGEWPVIQGVNSPSTTNASAPYIHNHDANIDYYYDLGAGNGKYVIIDLTAPKVFTHVSFNPRTYDSSTYYGYKGVAVYGSNDNSNWTELMPPTDDTKKWYYRSYNRLAFYECNTNGQAYRYVKFQTNGSQASTNYNRYVGIGVHDFTDGYQIELNNASDFNVGDYLTVMSDSGYSFASMEVEAYYAMVSNGGTDPEVFWHGGWRQQCQVIAKTGNLLSLDKPIFWGYVEGRDSVTVVKVNRNFNITGQWTLGSGAFSDYRWPSIQANGGSNYARRFLLKNVGFDKVGSYRYSGSTSFNRGITFYGADYWNSNLMDGCVVMQGNDSTTWGGVGSQYAPCVFRNNLFVGLYSGIWNYYSNSYAGGSAIWNNKFQGCIYGIYSDGPKAYDYSYNEISTCDIGIHFGTIRVARQVVPSFPKILRNQVKGTSNYGYRFYPDQPGPISGYHVEIEGNRVRATDDYSHTGWFTSSPVKDADALAEHTGSRMSRYRNEGHFATGDTISDMQTQQIYTNYGRYGIDIAIALYAPVVREYTKPGEYRIFNSNSDSQLAHLVGLEFDMIESGVNTEVDIYFEYRYPLMNRLQDDGTNDGRLTLIQTQGGNRTDSQYAAVPSTLTNEWTNFSGTFVFSPDRGPCAVFLNRSSTQGYMDIRNAYAVVRTSDVDKVIVRVNTFNLNRIFNPYRENEGDIRPLTAARAQKVNRLRF